MVNAAYEQLDLIKSYQGNPDAPFLSDKVPDAATDFTRLVLGYFENINFPEPRVTTVVSGAVYLSWENDQRELTIVIDRDGHWHRVDAYEKKYARTEKLYPTPADIIKALRDFDYLTHQLFKLAPDMADRLPQ